MSEHEQFKPEDDVVERAAAALRDVETPDGPSAELLADMLSAIRAKDSSKRRFWTMKTVTKFAVAAVLAVVIGVAAWTGAPWGGEPAFADVLEKVQQVHSVRFISQVNMPGKPSSGDVTTLIVGSRMRQDIKGEFINMMDFKSGQVLTLMVPQKRAIKMNIEGRPKEFKDRDILEQFRNMQASAGKSIGKKEIDGKVADAYAVEENGQKLTIWTDPKTRLPVRMETKVDMPMLPKMDVVMKNFEWDVAADESEISTEVPAGYTVQAMNFDGSKATEKDLVGSLRIMATANGGKFADSFDMAGMVGAMKGMKEAAKHGADQEKTNDAIQEGMKVMRGLMFVQKTNGEDFHYAGKGVEMGQAGRAVMWYRPVGGETYHVIDADMTVHEGVK
ncbi:MAG TPA: hypothetical protein VFE58_06895, partial [Tepidisphaeraceae bacterium]|nr:hypothetical protein [Tepidisphaeraceae bacterium]